LLLQLIVVIADTITVERIPIIINHHKFVIDIGLAYFPNVMYSVFLLYVVLLMLRVLNIYRLFIYLFGHFDNSVDDDLV